MAGKIKFHLNLDMIRARLKDLKYTYNDIVEKSYGQINLNMLKYFMNRGGMAEEETIQIMADILELDGSEIIEQGDLFSINIPYEINRLTRGLYSKDRENIQVVYAEKLKIFKERADLETMLEIAHFLLASFTRDDLFLNKESVPDIVGEIIKHDPGFKHICNHELTEINFRDVRDLEKEFINIVDEEYSPHQLFLIFLYVLILFDAVFLAECIASAYQLMPRRTNSKADQYYNLTMRTDDMRRTLIKKIIYSDGFMRFDGIVNGLTIEEAALDDMVLTGIILMLSACEICREHQKSLAHKSEYVNRAKLNEIITKIETVFSDIGLAIETTSWNKIENSRFGKHYFPFHALTRQNNMKPNDSSNDMMMGFCIGKILQ